MARYFFHLLDFTGERLPDEEGAEFSSLSEAKEHALGAMGELVAEAIKRRAEAEVDTILIADERGTQLAAVPVVAALPLAVVGLLKSPEKIVPKNRLEEYRLSADMCRRKAENAIDADDRESWLKLAHAWLQMLPGAAAPPADAAGWPEQSEEHSKASH